ncbi:MAG TPA: hypothetical protein VJN69_14640 [Candidatus Acidoferrales bacterium]|nr:hypothetical protein [Candidatus Acidoferrales bacterium]
MGFRRVGLLVAFALIAAAISCAGLRVRKQTVYQNEEFGITLKVPQGALLCKQPADEHDHGSSMLLGAYDVQGCGDLENSRSIWIFGSYNINDEAKSLRNFLRWLCFEEQGRGCDPAPPGLRVTGLPSMAGEASHAGWIDIIVGTKAGKPDPKFDPSVPSMNYSITLHTREKYLTSDLRIFRAVLGAIRIAPED